MQARPFTGSGAGPRGSDDPLVAVERATLAELRDAFERTALLVSADLQALDDKPVTLPGGQRSMPSTAPETRFAGDVASPARPATVTAVIATRPATGRPHVRPARRDWRRGVMIAIPLLSLLVLFVPDRLPSATTVTEPGTLVLLPRETQAVIPTLAPTTVRGPAPTATDQPVTATAPQPGATAIRPLPALVASPTGTPTTKPAATTRPTATLPPTPTVPPPTATPPAPAQLVPQVAAAEAALRSGSLEVAIDYGQGNRSSVSVGFDLGDAARARRLALVSSWTSRAGEQRLEVIAIGDRIWQRQQGGPWQPGVSQDGLWEQFMAYLPQIAGATGVTVQRAGDGLVLRWTDPARGAQMELQIDASSGRFRRLQETMPATAATMVVTYTGWNTPVTIAQPAP